MSLKSVISNTPEFDLPIHAKESSNPHPMIGMYFVVRPIPRIGKPYTLAGVVTSTITDGQHTYLMAETIRIGGMYDREKASQLICIRDFSGNGTALFRRRDEWLEAVQRRMLD